MQPWQLPFGAKNRDRWRWDGLSPRSTCITRLRKKYCISQTAMNFVDIFFKDALIRYFLHYKYKSPQRWCKNTYRLGVQSPWLNMFCQTHRWLSGFIKRLSPVRICFYHRTCGSSIHRPYIVGAIHTHYRWQIAWPCYLAPWLEFSFVSFFFLKVSRRFYLFFSFRISPWFFFA